MNTPNQKPIIVSIDGNIGAGKSTLFDYLKDKFSNNTKIIFLEEPVSVWQNIQDDRGNSLLELFYADKYTWAFSFQMAAYISRLALLKETIEKNPNAIIITERSLNTDRHVFAKMLYDYSSISEIDYQIYLKWFDTFAKDYPVSKVIYVKTDPYICYRRIKIRSRNGEVIPFEYLESCHEYHENMINLLTSQSVTVIDGNVDIKDNENILQVWFEKIEDVLYEYMH
jgi:deoxycitidine kinase/deoxyguanosine kinase